jgi:hypothetical protein
VKRSLLLILAFVLVVQSFALAEESEYYYVNVPIIKVYAHRYGYEIVYKVGSTKMASAYLPMEWFLSGGTGEFDYGSGTMYPYISVYYKQGKVAHFRLHLNSDTNDSRWGTFDKGIDAKALFGNVKELKFQY